MAIEGTAIAGNGRYSRSFLQSSACFRALVGRGRLLQWRLVRGVAGRRLWSLVGVQGARTATPKASEQRPLSKLANRQTLRRPRHPGPISPPSHPRPYSSPSPSSPIPRTLPLLQSAASAAARPFRDRPLLVLLPFFSRLCSGWPVYRPCSATNDVVPIISLPTIRILLVVLCHRLPFLLPTAVTPSFGPLSIGPGTLLQSSKISGLVVIPSPGRTSFFAVHQRR